VGLINIGLLPGNHTWGTGGGFLAGIALGWLLGYQERRPEGLGQRLLAGVCALATGGVLAWSAGFAITYRLLG
jgi:rhomboid protease GluP